jgi:D-3-phosphoglycerate dehydrogenase / 2-oxoglutarate reductase
MAEFIIVGLGPVPAKQTQELLGSEFTFIAEPTSEDLSRADGAIVRAEFNLDKAALESMPKLKIAVRTGVGVDRVDLASATIRGVSIAITPGANTNAVAEGAFAMMLSLSKKLSPLTELVRNNQWASRDSTVPGDLEGQTLGLIGFGRIGSRVAQLAHAFGMRVIAFDPVADIPENLKAKSMDDLISESNILSVHVPLNEKTRNLISNREIDLMPKDSIIINVARGGLVNLDAAQDALRSGKLSGLGLDSFDPEPAVFHECFNHPNVVLTPHVMGLSQRAREQTFAAAAQAIKDFFNETGTVEIVNSNQGAK